MTNNIDPAYEIYDECGCLSPDCYECRRREIDEAALKIHDREVKYCTGMTGFNIEDHAWKMANRYRCNEINKLALEFTS